MRKTLLNLLGILAFGLVFSTVIGTGMYMAEKRERANTASSEQYSIIVITGSLEIDQSTSNTLPYKHRLKLGRKVYLLDFSGEPAIREFTESRADSYLKVSGVKRNLSREAPDGTIENWDVIRVLEVKAFKPR